MMEAIKHENTHTHTSSDRGSCICGHTHRRADETRSYLAIVKWCADTSGDRSMGESDKS